MWYDTSDCRNLSSLGTVLRTSAVALRSSLAHVQRSGTDATLVLLLAAPVLLWDRPTFHPVCKSSVAIIRRGREGLIALAALWATFAMDVTAPLLLVGRPTGLPLVPVICAIEGVNFSDGQGSWQNRRCGTAPTHLRAALSLLLRSPCVL